MSNLLWLVPGGVLFVTLAYWLLFLTEGTYLGARFVALLYDWYAWRYDQTKNLSRIFEARFVGTPLILALRDVPAPQVLDVAAGTGRLALALLREEQFPGTIVGVDYARQMVRTGQMALQRYQQRVAWLLAKASALPFEDDTFDAVTCLEALEFMAAPHQVLCEMRRVLKPGAVLLLSNRVGWEARFFPGRLCGRGRLERVLVRLGLDQVRMERWQVHYDLVWARKPQSTGENR